MGIIFFNTNTAGGGGGGTVETLNNGLTLTGTNGQLGGALIQTTEVDSAGNGYEVVDNTGTNGGGVRMGVLPNQVFLSFSTDTGGSAGTLFLQLVGDITDNTNPFLNIIITDGDLVKSGFAVADSTQPANIMVFGGGPVGGKGMAYDLDYSAAYKSIDFAIPDLDYLRTVQAFFIANIDNSGFTASETILTAVANSLNVINKYRLNQYICIVTGTGTVVMNVTYTNQQGNVQTSLLTTQVGAGSTISTAMVIKPLNGSNMIINTVLTGTATYSAGVGIEELPF